MISITLRHAGVLFPPNELAGLSVAFCKISARSSSEYLLSEPRIRLVVFKKNNEQRNVKYQRRSSKAYVPIVLFFGGMLRISRKAPPKAMAKSFISILSKGLSPNFLPKRSWVHFSSA